MSDKNIALVTMAAALVSAIIVSVLAYKLNSLNSTVDDLKANPISGIKSLVGG